MDTKPLERFATSARRELINAVDAQATAVLAAGSVARSERAEAVRKLERQIGTHGRSHVIDKVAYTWFNRIIALRFMDARGYTDAGVVSPAQGQAHGQPEILADVKRGNLDVEVVVNTDTADAIIGLLDGTRRSTDPEGEAYALLLTEYCRYWHKSMPFMFEREGDYTELLVPVNLLAADAILARAREVLTEEVCDDVEVIGWLYQFYISERKEEVFAGFKKNKKAGADEIPAATQLFTPHWIVRCLVENSLGRLWMLNRPASRLVDRMEYYIAPVDDETAFLQIAGPEELTVIDPACGSGHMLTYAFDLLYAIYEEEGYAPADIPTLILSNNLHGTEIDPRAGSLAAFALTMKARARQRTFFNGQVRPKICVFEPITFSPHDFDFLVSEGADRQAEENFWNQFEHVDVVGSLIQPDPGETARLTAHYRQLEADGDIVRTEILGRVATVVQQARYLASKYAVVVANPPYMGSGNMSALLSEFARDRYPQSKFDLMTMFMERALAALQSRGYLAMITLSSWMFSKDATALRARILSTATVQSMVHLGRGVFGSDYGSVAFVIQSGHSPAARGIYCKLFERHVSVRKVEAIRDLYLNPDYGRFILPQRALEALPGRIFGYWIDPEVAEAFTALPSIGESYSAGNGITTSDNDRFLRFWWEVGASDVGHLQDRILVKRRWMPINKGGARRKWTGNREYVLDWRNDGKELFELRPKSTMRNVDKFFRRSVSWSDVCNGPVVARFYEADFAFESAANAALVETESDVHTLLSLTNSAFAAEVSAILNPGAHFKVGDFESIPLARRSDDGWQAQIDELIGISESDLETDELDRSFKSDQLLRVVPRLEGAVRQRREYWSGVVDRAKHLEHENNRAIASQNNLPARLGDAPTEDLLTLRNNPQFEYRKVAANARESAWSKARIDDLVSFAVGCMFGRYSLDEPGLIVADPGLTLQDYLAKVPSLTMQPDADNVIPLVDDGWFEDDIVERFRQFLRIAFGLDHFEENLRFIEESLGVKTLRDYFITKAGKSKFYDDHVQRYRKRPIYWMFSSPNGSFNALIYMHRYTPSTVSTVLNEYLREYRAKLEVAFANADLAKESREADRLRKVLVELAEYEHDVLYPLATQQIAIDLDDGVKTNYPKFYPALKKIAGLETAE